MAIKTLQTLAVRNAVTGVRVTGLECNGAMPADGMLRLLSLLWQTLSDPFAAQKRSEPQIVFRTGRSVAFAGVMLPTPSSHAPYRPTSRSVKRMRMVQG